MERRTGILKRITAACLCLAVLAVSCFVNAVITSAAEAEAYTPNWFDAASDSKWWDGNSSNGITGPDGGFLINRVGKVWQYYHRWSTSGGNGRLDCNSDGVKLNINEYSHLNFSLASKRAIDVYLQVRKVVDGETDWNTRSFIKLAELPDGASARSIKLTDNPEIAEMMNEDGVLFVVGISFYTKKFKFGDTIEVSSLNFTKEPEPQNFAGFERWFNSGNTSQWFDGNTNAGTSGKGFQINYSENSWQYELLKSNTGGTGRLDCNGPGLAFDLDEYNTVNYKISSPKSFSLFIQAYKLKNGSIDYNTRTFIELAQFEAGTHEGSFDLRSSEKLMAMLDSENRYFVAGYGFKTNGFKTGDTIEVTAFSLSLNKKEYMGALPPESWIIENNVSSWWNWDWNLATGVAPSRFTVKQAEDGALTVEFAGDFRDLKYMTDAVSLDLKKTPYLYVDFTTEVPCKLYLLVTGASQGNNGVLIEENVTGEYSKRIDIAETLADYVQNDRISLFGFRFEPTASPSNKKIVLRTMDFGDANTDLSGGRPAAPEVSVNTNEPVQSVEVTVLAPEDAKIVQYRLGAFGDWLEYTEPITVYKNIAVYGRYVSADGNWSMTGEYKIGNIQPGYTEDVEPVIPIWFNKGIEDDCWFNWDWAHGSNDQNRFFITYPEDRWTAEIGQDWCTRLETQANNTDYHVNIDLDEQSTLYYKIETDFALTVSLKVQKGGSNPTVQIGQIPAGRTSGSLDLAGNGELLSLSDDQNKMTVTGIVFTFAPKVGQTVKIDRIVFDSEDAYYEGYPGEETVIKEILPGWFSFAETDNWTSDGQIINKTDSGSEVFINTDNDWTYLVKDAQKAKNATSGGNAVRTNLKTANTLFINARSDFECTVQLAVKFKGKVYYLNAGTLEKGKNTAAFKLHGIPEFLEYSNNGNLNITAVRFIPKSAASGEELKIDLFAFNAEDKVYEGYPDEEAIQKDREAAAAVDAKIAEIGKVTLESRKVIEAARAAYDALTDRQKFYVTRYAELIAAENEYYMLAFEASGAIVIPEEEIIRYMEQNPGTSVEIKLEDGAVVSAGLLAAAKNYGCDLKICVYARGTDELIYSLLLKSSEMNDTSADFDAKLYTDVDGADLKALSRRLSSDKTFYFAFNKSNRIPAQLMLAVNGKNSLFKTGASALYGYYLDEVSGGLLYAGGSLKSGAAAIKLPYGGAYALSEQKVSAAGIIPETGDSSNFNIWLILSIISLGQLTACLVIRKKEGKEL